MYLVDYKKTEITKDYEIAKNRLDKEFETKIKREQIKLVSENLDVNVMKYKTLESLKSSFYNKTFNLTTVTS